MNTCCRLNRRTLLDSILEVRGLIAKRRAQADDRLSR
jgi:hypothetical protein